MRWQVVKQHKPQSILASVVASVVIVAGLGCSPESDETTKAKPAVTKKEKKSNVKRVVTTVPAGAQIACADLLPDISKFKELVAADIGKIVDQGKSNPSAAASCAFIKAGDASSSNAQLKKLKSKHTKLGVLPGDVYCKVTLFCSLATDEGDFRKKCKADEKKQADRDSSLTFEGNMDLGQFSCVRKADRPPNDWSYTYRTIDSDTRCIFEVIGGPSVVSQDLVQNCMRAALDSIGMANLKKYK